MKKNKKFIKLTQWEHWPSSLYYFPLIPIFIYRSIKAGHLVHFLTTNPNILYSGCGTESKFKTLELIPEKLRPISILATKTDQKDSILKAIEKKQLKYPLIAKPNIGFRGYLVKKIKDTKSLLEYIDNVQEDIIIQEFIPYLNELGIFYHRIPGDQEGKITSITIKKFITVTGDGKSTLSELIHNDQRAFLYEDIFKNIHKEKVFEIVEKGKEIVLTEIGNHSKGTEFINGNYLISEKLTSFINQFCSNIKGFYYGRLDIKFKDFDSLLQGESFKILEINGIISEPTHIYDATYKNASYIQSVKTINNHWAIMDKIAIKNHREYNVPYPKVIPFLKHLKWLRYYSKKLNRLHKMGV